MDIHRGDIVYIDLSVSEETQGYEASATTIIAPASSGQSGYPFQMSVASASSDFERDSVIMLDQIRTIDTAARAGVVVATTETAGRLQNNRESSSVGVL